MSLIKSFESLVEVMQKYDLYQLDDEVGMALNDLQLEIQSTEEFKVEVLDVLKDILVLAEQYDTEQQKFFDSCKNEDR